MKIKLENNKVFFENKGSKKEIHPFWLRERIDGVNFVDKGTQQRLFDPTTLKKNIEIKNLKNIKLKNNDHIFHAGTLDKNKKIYAVGGRVLNFVSLSNDFKEAKKNILKNINTLNWSSGFYRKDIGYKVIK